MAVVISLREVVDAIDSMGEECESYLDPETGEIILVTEEERRLVEEGADEEDLPDWQREILPKIRAALESDRLLILPDKFEIHEWSIMERFSLAQKDERVRAILMDAIHGSGAFRNFKGAVRRLGIEEAWYKFRAAEIEQIAREWLEEHKLPYK